MDGLLSSVSIGEIRVNPRKRSRRIAAAEISLSEFLFQVQNSVDTAFILPQYLGLKTLPVLCVGSRSAFGSRSKQPLQGKIVHGGNLHGNQEEGKKEETLTVSETKLRNRQRV